MSTTFANTIDGNKIYADRAEHDAAGNDIQTTYATKSEVPAAQVQADWSEADSSAVDFIKNKPANLVQDASYVHTDNNFTTALKDKLDGIASGAEVNVQADWAEADSAADSYIKNKPTIPAAPVQSNWNENDSSSLAYIQNKPSIPAAQVQSDWNQSDSNAVDYIKNKPTIPSVPVQDVEVDGTSVVNAQGVAEITMPTIPVTDVEVDGTSVVNAQGVAEITMPTFTQAQADWTESDTSDPSYIQNKPTVKPISAGTNVTITESQGNIVISASGGAAQQQADWNQTNSSAVDYIKNKPTIPAAQVQSNWAESNSGSVSYIQNKPAVLPVIAGTNVTITQDNNGVTISAAGSTQVQADWTEADNTDPSYIQNKPNLATVATSGSYNDLSNKPTIPAAPVQSDWTEADSSSLAYIANKPTLAAVATSGAYSDLSGTPTINNVPAVTSSDDSKVLKATYSGGVGSYSWEAESGGTVTDVEVNGTSVVSGGVASITIPAQVNADWDAVSGTAEILNKPVPKTLTAGTGISITESSNAITVATTGLIPEAPTDGGIYARVNGAWVDITSRLNP